MPFLFWINYIRAAIEKLDELGAFAVHARSYGCLLTHWLIGFYCRQLPALADMTRCPSQENLPDHIRRSCKSTASRGAADEGSRASSRNDDFTDVLDCTTTSDAEAAACMQAAMFSHGHM